MANRPKWMLPRGDTGPMGPPGPPGPLEMPMAALQAEIGRRLDRQMTAEMEKMMTMPPLVAGKNVTATEVDHRIAEYVANGAPYFDTVTMARALQDLHSRRHEFPIGNHGAVGMSQQPAPHQTLEVRDVERLAKAGVTMTFEQIKDRIKPDVDTTASPFAGGDMIRALYDRWVKAQPQNQDRSFFFAPWCGAAFKAGDKVKVFLCTQGARGVLLEDDFALYPSDALLASLIMMLKTETPGQ